MKRAAAGQRQAEPRCGDAPALIEALYSVQRFTAALFAVAAAVAAITVTGAFAAQRVLVDYQSESTSPTSHSGAWRVPGSALVGG